MVAILDSNPCRMRSKPIFDVAALDNTLQSVAILDNNGAEIDSKPLL
ncbi:hypothetical protein DYBT9623_05467 [Dyadobacter sp. CECT 9623]|uniref:Uncharacterized protein n=1 Tax=Dyadobacter linearis TaxID=2823330 RepID=A0ABM8UYM9_9BACT|nr:hypothetical protein DYBT9623_05467 [Dyadobacter sp. CECT 9623]